MTNKLQKKPATRRDAADAARLQAKGQNGDTILAHINPAEARLLDQLADGLLDGGGRNPKTGLLSFGMSDAEGPSGHDSNPGGVGGGPAGGQTGGGIGGNTAGGLGGLGGGYDGSTVNGRGGYSDPFGLAERTYDPTKMPSIESILALPDKFRAPGYTGTMTQYAPRDTLARLAQEYFSPSVKTSPYGPTTGTNLGFMGTLAGKLSGGPMSGLMSLGEAMGRASSPATQAASAAEMSARGGMNSTGQDRDSNTGLSVADLEKRDPGTQFAGTASGAQTARVPAGYTVNAAGQMIPAGNNNALSRLSAGPAYQDPIRNLLYDYILRGRQGGFGW